MTTCSRNTTMPISNDNNSHLNHLRPHKLTRPQIVGTNDSRQQKFELRKRPMFTTTTTTTLGITKLDQVKSTTITSKLLLAAGAQFVATQTVHNRRLTRQQCYRTPTTQLRSNVHTSPILATLFIFGALVGLSHQSSIMVSYLPDGASDSLSTTRGYMDANCFGGSPGAQPDPSRSSDAHKIIYLLKCDIFPLFRAFTQLLPHIGGPANVFNMFTGMNQLMTLGVKGDKVEATRSMWTNYLLMDKAVQSDFVEKVLVALDKREFCTFPTVSEFSELKKSTVSSQILTYVYDIITIDYHSYCLADALDRLPQVPHLVREVVDIYLTGADQQVALPLDDYQTAGNQILGDGEGLKEFKFDVNDALEKNGGLDHAVGLVFSMTNDNTVEAFKSSCKEFLIQIGERWQSMEMMSKLLNTDGNGIERVNNYIMRRLIPTKYADICTQLSLTS